MIADETLAPPVPTTPEAKRMFDQLDGLNATITPDLNSKVADAMRLSNYRFMHDHAGQVYKDIGQLMTETGRREMLATIKYLQLKHNELMLRIDPDAGKRSVWKMSFGPRGKRAWLFWLVMAVIAYIVLPPLFGY